MSLKTAFYLGSFLTMLPLSSPLLAQANSVAVENGSSKDVYQQAVDHLGKLGFPSVKGAKYYHLSDHYNDRGRFSSERGSIKIKGNGFLIEKGGKKQFTYNFGLPLEYSKSRDYKPGVCSGKLNEADLGKDLDALIKGLSDPAVVRGLRDTWRYSDDNQSKYFLLGCFAYSNGQKVKGKQVIDLLLKICDTEDLLDKVVTMVANQQYQKAYSAFTQTKDWKKYKSDVDGLIKKYTRGWPTQKALMILSKKIDDHLTLPSLKVVAPKGIKLNEKLVALFEKEVSKGFTGMYGNWLLSSRSYGGRESKLMSEIAKGGMDSVILLASLVDSEYMLLSNDRHGYSGSSYYSSSEDDPVALYRNLTKPSTVGEVARSWISRVVPGLNDSDLEPDQVKAIAIEWWKKNKDKSRMDIIKGMIADIDDDNYDQIIQPLLTENSDESHKLFEKIVMESKSSYRNVESVKVYARKRKKEAKPFVLAFLKKFDDEKAEFMQMYGGSEHGKEAYESMVNSLKALTEDVDLKVVLKAIQRADISEVALKKYLAQLQVSLTANEIMGDKYRPLLVKALANKSPNICSIVYTFMRQTMYTAETELGKTAKENKVIIGSEERLVWSSLIVDTRKVNTIGAKAEGMEVIGDMAIYIVYQLVYGSSEEMYIYRYVVGPKELLAMVKLSAVSYVKHGKLSPMPKIADINEEAITVILERIKSAKLTEVNTVYDALKINEKGAYFSHLRNGANPAWMDKNADVLVSLDFSAWKSAKPNQRKVVEEYFNKHLQYKSLDAKGVQVLLQFVLDQQDVVGDLMISIQASKHGVGKSLMFANFPEGQGYTEFIKSKLTEPFEKVQKKESKGFIVMVDMRSGENMASWIQGESVAKNWTDAAKMLDDDTFKSRRGGLTFFSYTQAFDQRMEDARKKAEEEAKLEAERQENTDKVKGALNFLKQKIGG